MRTRRTDDQLQLLRKQFAQKLIALLREGKEVIYADETSTNLWEKRLRTWYSPDDPIAFQLPGNRGKSITVIGALSSVKTKPLYWTICSNTDTDSVIQFMIGLTKRYRSRELVIVLDNHPAHRSNKFTAFAEKYRLTLLFLPPSSSFFNPVERAWAVLKLRWARHL